MCGVYGIREKRVTSFTDVTGQCTHTQHLLSSGCRQSTVIQEPRIPTTHKKYPTETTKISFVKYTVIYPQKKKSSEPKKRKGKR